MLTDINLIWSKIIKHQRENFYTIRGKLYTYIVEDDNIIIPHVKNGRIPKNNIEKALAVKNPSPQKIGLAGVWGPSYVYGIITDDRIKNN